MIHIEGHSISPFLGHEENLRRAYQRDPKLLAMQRQWRESLRETFGVLTHHYKQLAKEEVCCSFPHDPSVPIDPYPTALLIVRLPCGLASEHTRLEYAMGLGQALERRLNDMRSRSDSRVEVHIFEVVNDPACHYVTPARLSRVS